MKHSSIQFVLVTCQQRNQKNKQTDKDLFSAQPQEKKIAVMRQQLLTLNDKIKTWIEGKPISYIFLLKSVWTVIVFCLELLEVTPVYLNGAALLNNSSQN